MVLPYDGYVASKLQEVCQKQLGVSKLQGQQVVGLKRFFQKR
jgi:hypothetical protein